MISADSRKNGIVSSSEEIRQKLEIVKSNTFSLSGLSKVRYNFQEYFLSAPQQNMTEVMKFYLKKTTENGAQVVNALESSGLFFGPQMGMDIGIPFVPIRKKGELPGKTISVDYKLEYGKNAFEAQKGCLSAGDKVLIVDNLLATGGSLVAACELIKKLAGEVQFLIVMELPELQGRENFPATVTSLIQF